MERLRISFRYRRGDVVGYGVPRTTVTIVWQDYQTRDVLGPLVTYLVEDAAGHTFWVNEADLVALEGEHL